jgi:hypothetical protein
MDFDPYSGHDLAALAQQLEIIAGELEGDALFASFHLHAADHLKVLSWKRLAEQKQPPPGYPGDGDPPSPYGEGDGGFMAGKPLEPAQGPLIQEGEG